MPGEQIDLSSEPSPAATAPPRRRFIGMHFACCDVYTRIYVNREETAYVGRCPRCSRRVQLQIGPGGSDARFFTAR